MACYEAAPGISSVLSLVLCLPLLCPGSITAEDPPVAGGVAAAGEDTVAAIASS